MTVVPNIWQKLEVVINQDITESTFTAVDVYQAFSTRYRDDITMLEELYRDATAYSAKRYMADRIREYLRMNNSRFEDTRETVPIDDWPSGRAKVYRRSHLNVYQHEVAAGIVEVSIALAGISVAITAILFTAGRGPRALWLLVLGASTFAAVSSVYAALWLLARYCLTNAIVSERTSWLGWPPGVAEVLALLVSPEKGEAYWFLALGLMSLFAVILLIVILALF